MVTLCPNIDFAFLTYVLVHNFSVNSSVGHEAAARTHDALANEVIQKSVRTKTPCPISRQLEPVTASSLTVMRP